MIISIYGLPRSGKDTFISKIVSNSKNAIHIKGSETLNQISFVKYGCSFHDLSTDKMNQVRKDFTFEVPSYQTMINEMAEWVFNHKELYKHYFGE